MFGNSNYIEKQKTDEVNSKSGFLSTKIEFLKVIFRLSFILFHEKKSKYTFDKTFYNYFTQKIKEDNLSFKNFICQLSDELTAFKNLLRSDDIDFKPKDLNLDILIPCVNNLLFILC